jgi:hypothetical protein
MIQTIIYFMCAATSAACALLLLRGYANTKVALLFWSALCFVGLGFSNILLVIDLVLLPTQLNLLPVRHVITLSSLTILLYGLIWETR